MMIPFKAIRNIHFLMFPQSLTFYHHYFWIKSTTSFNFTKYFIHLLLPHPSELFFNYHLINLFFYLRYLPNLYYQPIHQYFIVIIFIAKLLDQFTICFHFDYLLLYFIFILSLHFIFSSYFIHFLILYCFLLLQKILLYFIYFNYFIPLIILLHLFFLLKYYYLLFLRFHW